MSGIQVVEELYNAFGRGDIPAILRMVSESVEWGHPDSSTDLPFLQPGRGRDHVAKFFEAFTALQMNAFHPKLFLEKDGTVVVLVDEDVTVKSTGNRIPSLEQVHVWKVDERAQITAHYWYMDTHRFWSAAQRAR